MALSSSSNKVELVTKAQPVVDDDLELAEWLVTRDGRERARPHVAAAREIFERLKARPSLERLMKLEAS